jgi:DNA-binding CsgD family transcriptional regulator
VSSLIIFTLSFGPELLQQAVLILSPLPIALGVRKTVKRINAKGFYTHGLSAQLFIPYRFLFTALLHGLSIGVTIGLFPLFDKSYGIVHLILLSYALAAVLLFTITVLFRSDYNHLIYQIGFPLVALGALLVLCLSGFPEIGLYVQLFGFCFLHLIMWGVCTYFIKNLSLPATWVIATSTCAFMCGQFLGGGVSAWVAGLPEVEQGMRIVAAVMIFVVLFGSLLLISNRNLKTGWGLARFGSNELSDATSELAIKALIVEYALTKREADTLRLLVRGKSRKAISDELFVSEETIKYHAHSIYGKLAVHSRQELITIFDERRLQTQLEEPASQFE